MPEAVVVQVTEQKDPYIPQKEERREGLALGLVGYALVLLCLGCAGGYFLAQSQTWQEWNQVMILFLVVSVSVVVLCLYQFVILFAY